jgi:hypothetical protein
MVKTKFYFRDESVKEWFDYIPVSMLGELVENLKKLLTSMAMFACSTQFLTKDGWSTLTLRRKQTSFILLICKPCHGMASGRNSLMRQFWTVTLESWQ